MGNPTVMYNGLNLLFVALALFVFVLLILFLAARV